MNAVTANTKTTLLLNNAWQPITVVTARAAFSHLHKRRISALDKDGNVFHSLDTWNCLAEYYDDQPFLRSAHAGWPIPTVIVVNSKFFRKPKKKKLTLFDLAKLCEYTCQYCFEKFPLKQLSIDHVQPRSKGGEDLHDNRVLSCIRCNRAKSDFSPWLDKNGQVPKAPNIPALMLNAEKIRPEWSDFLKNVF
jgi:5-methylcytosine-specific restriction endonuclease McrA